MVNYREMFVMFSSQLHKETIYIVQILRNRPIWQLIANPNTYINAFIIVRIHFHSIIFKIDATIQCVPHL